MTERYIVNAARPSKTSKWHIQNESLTQLIMFLVWSVLTCEQLTDRLAWQYYYNRPRPNAVGVNNKADFLPWKRKQFPVWLLDKSSWLPNWKLYYSVGLQATGNLFLGYSHVYNMHSVNLGSYYELSIRKVTGYHNLRGYHIHQIRRHTNDDIKYLEGVN